MGKDLLQIHGLPNPGSLWLTRLVGVVIVLEILVLIAAGVAVSVHQQEGPPTGHASGMVGGLSRGEVD